MTVLTQERCVACRRDAPHVTEEEIAELHPQVSEWELIDEGGIPKLDRMFKFSNFGDALAFTEAVGERGRRRGSPPETGDRVGQGPRDVVDAQDPEPAPQRLHNGRQDGRVVRVASVGL